MRSTKSQAYLLIFSSPLGSQNWFLPPLLIDTLVCMPLPFTPTTGFRQEAYGQPIFVAT
jgi:hypothetical protein